MAATKFSSCLALTCLVMVVLYSTPTLACDCPKVSLKEKLAKAEYVDFVRVMDKSTANPDGVLVNKVNIVFKYKAVIGGKNILGNVALKTPPEGDSCHIDLEKGKYYFIAGNGSNVNKCDFIVKLDAMSRAEAVALKNMYMKILSGSS